MAREVIICLSTVEVASRKKISDWALQYRGDNDESGASTVNNHYDT